MNNYDNYYTSIFELDEINTFHELADWIVKYDEDECVDIDKVKGVVKEWLEVDEFESVTEQVADGLEADAVKTMPDGCSDMDYELDRLREQAYADVYNWQHKNAYNWQHKKRRKK